MSTQSGPKSQSAKKEDGVTLDSLLTQTLSVSMRRTGRHTVVETIYHLTPKSSWQNKYSSIHRIKTEAVRPGD